MLCSVDETLEALGGTTAVAEMVGLGAPAVSRWRERGFIPSAHFFVLSGELEKRGAEVDRAVFGFKAAAEASQ